MVVTGGAWRAMPNVERLYTKGHTDHVSPKEVDMALLPIYHQHVVSVDVSSGGQSLLSQCCCEILI